MLSVDLESTAQEVAEIAAERALRSQNMGICRVGSNFPQIERRIQSTPPRTPTQSNNDLVLIFQCFIEFKELGLQDNQNRSMIVAFIITYNRRSLNVPNFSVPPIVRIIHIDQISGDNIFLSSLSEVVADTFGAVRLC